MTRETPPRTVNACVLKLTSNGSLMRLSRSTRRFSRACGAPASHPKPMRPRVGRFLHEHLPARAADPRWPVVMDRDAMAARYQETSTALGSARDEANALGAMLGSMQAK